MFNRILVPLDGSLLAERVIPHVEQFARIFGSNILLLQILDPTSYHEHTHTVDPLSWQIRKTEADMYMNSIATRIRADLGLSGESATKNRVEYAIREGKTAENIVNFAHSEKVDLLVICTHGAGGLSKWNISSITHKVINMIYLPVLLIRSFILPEPESSNVNYRRILLPFDSSRRAESSLAVAISLARGEPSRESGSDLPAVSFKTSLLLTAVIKPPELPIPEPYPDEIKQLSEQLMDASRQAVGNYLNEMKERLPVECEVCVVENCSVPSAIHEIADREKDIDLVVLCAHGFSGQVTWPYGSVTRNYIEHGTKPVLIVQDIIRSQVPPTAAEIAAEASGER